MSPRNKLPGLDGLERWIVRRVRRSRPLLARFGFDAEILALLLSNTFIVRRRRTGKTGLSVGLAFVLAMQFGLGFILGVLAHGGKADIAGSETLVIGFAAAAACFPLTLEAPALLFNREDVEFLMPFPNGMPELMLARVGLVLTYVLGSALVLLPGCMIVGGLVLSSWWTPLVLAIGIPLTSVSLGLAYCIGLLLMLMVLERLRIADQLANFQLIGLFLVYCILHGAPKYLVTFRELGFFEEHPALLLMLPHAWAGGLGRLLRGAASVGDLGLVALMVLTPLALLAVLRTCLSAQLGSSLHAMHTTARAPKARRMRRLIGRPWRALSARITQPGIERAGFQFFLGVPVKESTFKLRAFSFAAYMGAMGVMMLVGKDAPPLGVSLDWILASSLLLIPIMLLQALAMSPWHPQADAAWIFTSLKPAQQNLFQSGVVKSAMLLFFGLPVLLFSVLSLFLVGPGGLPEMATGAAVAYAAICVTLCNIEHVLPATRPPGRSLDVENTAPVLGLMAALVPLGIGLVCLSWVPFAAWFMLPLALFAAWRSHHKFFDTGIHMKPPPKRKQLMQPVAAGGDSGRNP